MGLKVTLREDETVDNLIRRFKKRYNESGIKEDCKKHEFFLKKSLRRKEKSKKAQIRRLKAMKRRRND